jgi:prepilin-type N-terminal cleavage/methylation domain-containing protein
MRTSQQNKTLRRRAYTLTEVLVSVGVIGVLFVSLYLAFSVAFTVIRVARENLRATQILVQREETVRLYTWSQLQDPTYFKTNFVDSYAPLGITYYGAITLAKPVNMGTPSYLADMRTMTLTVRWTNNIGRPLPHVRQMETQVARYGLQNYVFGGTTP